MTGQDTLDKEMIHVLGQMEQDSLRFHQTTQKSAQLKIYELFISGSFHLMFSDHSRPGINETTECETMDKWRSMALTKHPNYCNSVWVPHLKRDTNQTLPKGNVSKRDLKPG